MVFVMLLHLFESFRANLNGTWNVFTTFPKGRLIWYLENLLFHNLVDIDLYTRTVQNTPKVSIDSDNVTS